MLREHCNHEELEAHRILDQVQAGLDAPNSAIAWALFVLGDGVGLVSLKGESNANS
jgi:hypothetical protein